MRIFSGNKIEHYSGLGRDERVFDLRAMLGDISHQYVKIAEARGIALALEISGHIPGRIYGDPRRLGALLHNLLSCCLENLDDGGIFLKIETRPLAGAKCRLDLVIRDSGLGIPDYKLRSIFQPTYLKDGPNNNYRVLPSLYLAKTLAILLGGDLSVASSYGRGTRYAIRLDLNLAPRYFYQSKNMGGEDSSRPSPGRRKSVITGKGRRLIHVQRNFDLDN